MGIVFFLLYRLKYFKMCTFVCVFALKLEVTFPISTLQSFCEREGARHLTRQMRFSVLKSAHYS